MYGSLGASIVSLKKLLEINSTVIDNTIFKLHYRITCLILVVCCFIVSTRQVFGEEISCYTGAKDIIPREALNTFCWIQSTFTVDTKNEQDEILAPGVRPSTQKDEKIYHKYYQWVGLTLFAQALLFYLPHFLWKMAEANKMYTLKQDLQFCFHPPEDDKDNDKAKRNKWDIKVDSLADYFIKKRGDHVFYSLTYFGCELLNFFFTILQMWLIDLFLGNEFLKYGYNVIKFLEMDQEDRHDPMILVFPRLTKCIFRNYGPSGHLQIHDALCVMPLNIANEKIYVIVWFWMLFLLCLSSLVILYRIPILLHSHFRTVIAIRFYTHAADLTKLAQIYYVSNIGDWLILRRLSQNIDGEHFSLFIDTVYDVLVHKKIILLKHDEEKQPLRKDSTISEKLGEDGPRIRSLSNSKPKPTQSTLRPA